jgi:hypothetical protein
VSGRRKSTPNLVSFEGQDDAEVTPKGTVSFTYEDLYQKQLLQKHHSHGRRSRRYREYDSDTGYRSDREMQYFRRQFSGRDYEGARDRDDLSVRSQPLMSRSHHHHHHRRSREGGGYASDLEAYAGRGRGWTSGSKSPAVGRDRKTAPSPLPKPHHLHPTHSLPQDLDKSPTTTTPTADHPSPVFPGSPNMPNGHPPGIPPSSAYPSSASQFADHSLGAAASMPPQGYMPQGAYTPGGVPQGAYTPGGVPQGAYTAGGVPQGGYTPGGTGQGVYTPGTGEARSRTNPDLQRELHSVLEERSKNAVGRVCVFSLYRTG